MAFRGFQFVGMGRRDIGESVQPGVPMIFKMRKDHTLTYADQNMNTKKSKPVWEIATLRCTKAEIQINF